MSRYMDPELADQLMTADGNDTDIMGGKQSVGTVLFSDARSFTTIQRNWVLREPSSCSTTTSQSWSTALPTKVECSTNS